MNTRVTQIEQLKLCPTCKGYGHIDSATDSYQIIRKKCPDCDGAGRLIEVIRTERNYKKLNHLK